MPPKKKTIIEEKPVNYKLVNTYLLPNVTVNSIPDAIEFRSQNATNIDLWDKLSIWTANNESENKEINLDSFLETPNYNLSDLFLVPEITQESTTEVSYHPVVFERLRQIENAKRLEAEEKNK